MTRQRRHTRRSSRGKRFVAGKGNRKISKAKALIVRRRGINPRPGVETIKGIDLWIISSNQLFFVGSFTTLEEAKENANELKRKNVVGRIEIITR